MKYAADFRRITRNALSGRWTIAMIAGFLAPFLKVAPNLNWILTTPVTLVLFAVQFYRMEYPLFPYLWNRKPLAGSV